MPVFRLFQCFSFLTGKRGGATTNATDVGSDASSNATTATSIGWKRPLNHLKTAILYCHLYQMECLLIFYCLFCFDCCFNTLGTQTFQNDDFRFLGIIKLKCQLDYAVLFFVPSLVIFCLSCTQVSLPPCRAQLKAQCASIILPNHIFFLVCQLLIVVFPPNSIYRFFQRFVLFGLKNEKIA